MVPVLVLLFVALLFILRGDLFYVLPCVILFLFFFFSPFSIAITSLGKESAFRTFVRFALVRFCLFPLPLGVWEGLRFVIVALLGLFSYLFFAHPHSLISVVTLDLKALWVIPIECPFKTLIRLRGCAGSSVFVGRSCNLVRNTVAQLISIFLQRTPVSRISKKLSYQSMSIGHISGLWNGIALCQNFTICLIGIICSSHMDTGM